MLGRSRKSDLNVSRYLKRGCSRIGHRKTAKRPFGSIIREANSTVDQEAGKSVPALEHIVDWPGGGARQTRPLLTQPSFQIVNKLSALRSKSGSTTPNWNRR